MAAGNEMQVGRFNALITKLLSMKENAPTPTVGSELIPTLVLENDRIEWLFLGGQYYYTLYGDQAATAANYSRVNFSNPANSGVLAVIETAYFMGDGGAATQVQYFNMVTNGNGYGGVYNQAVALDTRSSAGAYSAGTPKFSACGVATSISVANFARDLRVSVPVGTTQVIPLSVVVKPGDQVLIESSGVNIRTVAGFRWRERVLEPSETR